MMMNKFLIWGLALTPIIIGGLLLLEVLFDIFPP